MARRGWRRALLGGGLIALALAGGALWLRPTPVTVAEVVVSEVGPAVQGVGTVEARTVVVVGSKVTGRLVAVNVDLGDGVRAGQVLARLDDGQQQADVLRSEAALWAAEAQQRDLEAGARPEEIAEARANVRREQARLDDLLAGARAQEIEDARQRLRSATATRVMTERDLRRARDLFARELIAAQEVDRARQAYEVAAAQEGVARQGLALAEAGARGHQVEAARASLRAAQDRLDLLQAGPRPHQVEAARAQVREARAVLALARSRLEDTVVPSPLDGYVVSREQEPGSTLSPGAPVLKLADPATTWVTVHVDGSQTGALAVGDHAEIRLRSRAGQTLPGRVARIRRESDRVTEQLAVDVAFDERPPRLTLGEQAEATIRPVGRAGALAMPAAALIRGPDGPAALVVEDGRLLLRPLEVGLPDGQGGIEVRRGLRAGDRVVLAPGRLAEPGQQGRRVSVGPAAAPLSPAAAAR